MGNAVPAATPNLRMRDVLAAIKRAMPIAGPGIRVQQTTAGSIIINNAMGSRTTESRLLMPFDVRMHKPENKALKAEVYLPAGAYTAGGPYTPLNAKAKKSHRDDKADWYEVGDLVFRSDESEETEGDEGDTITRTPAHIRALALPGSLLVVESYPAKDGQGYDPTKDLSLCAYATTAIATVWKVKDGESTSYSVEQIVDGAVRDPAPDNPERLQLAYTLEDVGGSGANSNGKKIKKVEVRNVYYQCGQYLVYGEEDAYEIEAGDKKAWLQILHPPANPSSNAPPLFELSVEKGTTVPQSTDAMTCLHLYDFMAVTVAGNNAWFPTRAGDTRKSIEIVPYYS